MIELHMGNGHYLILATNHEDLSMDIYMHKHGQIDMKSLKKNIKKFSELLDYIDTISETV